MMSSESGSSLRVRLLTGAALWIGAALIGAWVMLDWLVEQHMEGEAFLRLNAHLEELVTSLEQTPIGGLSGDSRAGAGFFEPRVLSDPLFRQPYSGLYWQIDRATGDRARSTSLSEVVLELAAPFPIAGARELEIPGPGGETLLAVERVLTGADPGSWTRLVVAADAHVVQGLTQPAGTLLAVALTVLAIGLMAAAGLQVSAGLRPLRRLKLALVAVRRGEKARLDGTYPEEVRLLVDELNAFLAHNDAVLARARIQAANLAHGLKTPLAVVVNEALDGTAPIPAPVRERLLSATRSMHRLMDTHLARARMGSTARLLGSRTHVQDLVHSAARTLQRLHADRILDLRIDVGRDAVFSGEKEDLQEILGNLVDNACKWARSTVEVTAHDADGALILDVNDDGPGISEKLHEQVLRPGGRLDEAMPGCGLGLSIVVEIVESYGGRLELARSGLGGLRVRVHLPAG